MPVSASLRREVLAAAAGSGRLPGWVRIVSAVLGDRELSEVFKNI